MKSKIDNRNKVKIKPGASPVGETTPHEFGDTIFQVICYDCWDGSICVKLEEGSKWFRPDDLEVVE